MPFDPTLALFAAAALGVAAIALQLLLLRRHLRGPVAVPRSSPGVSVLKPLCGLDDRLEENLASFAALAWPDLEVLLGVRSPQDAAYPLACAAARRWPGRFRVVLQRGAPGLNPKVNQLVTLARAARHDLLVVSDSNVRVGAGYVAEIVALLEDEEVGLVTHPLSGEGEARIGSLMDHLHLTAAVTPGIVAAKSLAAQDIVVGKSMALRRRDLDEMGGFEAVQDVLAEDFVMGRMVGAVLGKRVAVARTPVRNVSASRSLRDFSARYRRWGVIQRQAAGRLPYAGMALLNPILLASLGTALSPGVASVGALAATCGAKIALDGAAARLLRPRGFRLGQLAMIPAKDLLFGTAWALGLFRREVDWRGTRIVVGPGTRIEAPERAAAPAPAATPAA